MQRITNVLIDPLLIATALILLFIAMLVVSHARKERNTMGLLSLFVLVVALTVLIGSPAVVNRLVAKLESVIPHDPVCAAEFTPLVVLGGGLDSRIRSVDQIHYMSEATLARVSEAQRMIRVQAGLDFPVVLAGGGHSAMTEAEVMQEFLVMTDIPEHRLYLEVNSLNTYTNAVNVARIFEQNEWRKEIRLITSALHMRRAVGVFRRQGFDVCAIGVDQQAIQGVPKYALLPQTTVLVKSDKLLHELAGILYYRLRAWM